MPRGEDETVHDLITYNMRKSLDLDVDGCILVPGEKRSLLECGFNVTAKTIFIIHGWTVKQTPFSTTLTQLASMSLCVFRSVCVTV